MRLCVLSSGSGGNCLWVSAGSQSVLVDAGLSARETARRCAEAGLRLGDLTAILLTHEHADHAGGAGVLSRKLDVPVYATAGTLSALRDGPPIELCRPLLPGQPVRLSAPQRRSPQRGFDGDPRALATLRDLGAPREPELWASPLPVAHDACEPVAFSLEERCADGSSVRAANVTDLGHAPASLAEQLCGHDALVLEMNHDLRRLLDGPYPWSLKRRVRSPVGHLSNAQGAGLLSAVVHERLRAVVLAHLSQENNSEALARGAAEPVLERAGSGARLTVGSQTGVGEVIELRPLPPLIAAPRQLRLF